MNQVEVTKKRSVKKGLGLILICLFAVPALLQFQNCAPIGDTIIQEGIGASNSSGSGGDYGSNDGSLMDPPVLPQDPEIIDPCLDNKDPSLFTQLNNQSFSVGMDVGAGTTSPRSLEVFGSPGEGELQTMVLRCTLVQRDMAGNNSNILNVGCNNQAFQVQGDGSYRAIIRLQQGRNTECVAGTVEVRYRAEDQCGARTPERSFTVTVSDGCRPEVKKMANDARNGARLGSKVDIDGNFLVASADGDTNANGDLAGAAYVFRREGTSWVQEAKLLPQDSAGMLERAGVSAVAISGNTVAVGSSGRGANSAGAVYIFRRGSGGGWTQTQRLDPVGGNANGGDWFGFDVAFSGSRLVVGAPRSAISGTVEAGAVYSFIDSGGSFSSEAVLTASSPIARSWLGFSVDVAGNSVAAGAPVNDLFVTDHPGYAYVFQGSGSNWSQAQLQVNNTPNRARFGFDVTVHGSRVAVGAPFAGAGFVAVFSQSGENWSSLRVNAPRGSTTFGSSVALQVNTLLVGAPSDNSKKGAVFHYDLDGSNQQTESRFKLMARDRNDEPESPVQRPGEFGNAVALDAGRAAVGSWAKFLFANELDHTTQDVDRGGAIYIVELLQ